MSQQLIQRTSVQLYRDCLRLVRHTAPGIANPKARALRATVRAAFRRPYDSEAAVEAAKQGAVRALANYLLAAAAPRDTGGVGGAMRDYYRRSAAEARRKQEEAEADDAPTTAPRTGH